MDYKNAGVDIEAGYKSVELMKDAVKSTLRPEVLGGIGGFSGAFSLEKIKDKVKYTIDFEVIKDKNGNWKLSSLSNETIKKIQGMY